MAKSGDTLDWQDGKSLSECMIYMLEKEIMSDVTFRVGTEQSVIKAHKYMLASRSPVFYTMFEGSCPEKGEVIVPDVNLATFKVLLKYIYSDVLDLYLENIFQVFYVAEKYMLSTLKNECSSMLSSSVETANAPVVLNVATQFHLETLIQKSRQYIQKNAVQCFLSPNAMKMSKTCMESILRLDSLSCSETDICRFFLKWAIHQCEAEGKTASGENMRNIAGSLLYLVNFPLVDKEYFANEIAHCGLLTLEEIVSVFYSHYGRKNDIFTMSVRKTSVLNKCYSVLRHSSVKSGWSPYDCNKYNALKITVNQNIDLKAIIVYGPVDELETYTSEIIVKILTDKGNEIHNKRYKTCTERCEMQTILLSELISINANNSFTLMVNSIKCSAYYGTQCKPDCRIDDVIVTFENSPNCTTATTELYGQIAGIEFNV